MSDFGGESYRKWLEARVKELEAALNDCENEASDLADRVGELEADLTAAIRQRDLYAEALEQATALREGQDETLDG